MFFLSVFTPRVRGAPTVIARTRKHSPMDPGTWPTPTEIPVGPTPRVYRPRSNGAKSPARRHTDGAWVWLRRAGRSPFVEHRLVGEEHRPVRAEDQVAVHLAGEPAVVGHRQD